MLRKIAVLTLLLAAVGAGTATVCLADYAQAAKAYRSGDYPTAYREYLALARAGDARAQANVGWMYQSGEGVPVDQAAALSWYLKAAEQGERTAQYNLGYAYENGLGTEPDLAKALGWYGKAALNGDVEAGAGYNRVQSLRSGQRVPQPPQDRTALDSVRTVPSRPLTRPEPQTARVQAQAQAQTEPVSLPVKRLQPVQAAPPARPAPAPTPTVKVQPVAPVAAPWEPAGEQLAREQLANARGHEGGAAVAVPARVATAPARVQVAAVDTRVAPAPVGGRQAAAKVVPVKAPLVPVVPNSKLDKYRKAAEAGDVDAQLYLGFCYSSGKDLPKDKAQAVKWYRKAGAAGSVHAQTALGWIYFSGEAGRVDLDESRTWYRQAAAKGDAKAKMMLLRIEKQLAKH